MLRASSPLITRYVRSRARRRRAQARRGSGSLRFVERRVSGAVGGVDVASGVAPFWLPVVVQRKHADAAAEARPAKTGDGRGEGMSFQRFSSNGSGATMSRRRDRAE